MNRTMRNKNFQADLAFSKKRDREDRENRSNQWHVDAPSSPIVATKRNATSQLSKLFLQRHSPSGCVGAALLSNVHRLHLNAEIHGLCGRPLSLHAFAPKMKADSVLDVSTSTTRCLMNCNSISRSGQGHNGCVNALDFGAHGTVCARDGLFP